MKKIEQIIAAQRQFFATGATRDIDGRIESLKRFKAAVEEFADEMTAALSTDLGKSEFEAYMTEIGITLSEIDTLIGKLPRWARDEKHKTPIFLFPASSRVVHEPLGVVLIIAPWNYPMQLALTPLAGAIAAGNCAVMKVSQNTPNVAVVVGKIISRAFAPEHVVLLENTPEIREQMLEGVYDHIFFTGGTEFARTVMTAAARNLTPVVLELGGKSPCIVGVEANLDIAARRIMWGKLLNCGQTCIAPDYLLVHRSVAEQLFAKMKAATVEFYGENPSKSPDYPRIVSVKEAERLAGLIKTAGGEVVMGGETDAASRYIAPTIIRNVPLDHELMRREIFGPILPAVVFETMDEVAEFINARPKPLAFYYFGSRRNGREIIARTSSGGACINDTIMHCGNLHLPFGGVGNSGMGRYHGRDSFLAFTNRRALLSSSTRIDIKVRYAPFKGLKLLKKVL